MCKTVIWCTSVMSTLFIAFHSCMVTTCMCVCTGVSKNSWSSTVSVDKNLILCGQTLFLCKAVIACSMSPWPCHLPWLYMPCICHVFMWCAEFYCRSTIACSIYVIAIATTFMLNFRIHRYLFYALSLPADLSVAARTIHNTHGGYNFSVRSCNKCLLLSGALGSNYLILDKYCAQATFTIATYNRTFTAARN